MKLKIGDQAPNFEGINQDGKVISLLQFANKKLVLYFYPKDNTPGCTAEACSLRDNYHELIKQGYEIIGVSPDNEASHKKFIEKQDLPFDLIADKNKEILSNYGTWGEKIFCGKRCEGVIRTTFIIENGIITDIIEKVNTKNHSSQILK